MPPKAKKSKAKAPGKSVPHGEEFDAPFVPLETKPVSLVGRSAEFDAGANEQFRSDRANLNESVLLHRLIKLEESHSELEGDLVRIVDLIVKGDIDSVKFKEILSKRQGPKP